MDTTIALDTRSIATFKAACTKITTTITTTTTTTICNHAPDVPTPQPMSWNTAASPTPPTTFTTTITSSPVPATIEDAPDALPSTIALEHQPCGPDPNPSSL
ncbi:hypothetical protein SprV_0100282900 [Sparganum proliferum]